MGYFTAFLLVLFGLIVGTGFGWYVRGWFRVEVTQQDLENLDALKKKLDRKLDPIPGAGENKGGRG